VIVARSASAGQHIVQPISTTKGITDPDPATAEPAFNGMIRMRKTDIAAIEKARYFYTDRW
jgi:hypothetical protein